MLNVLHAHAYHAFSLPLSLFSLSMYFLFHFITRYYFGLFMHLFFRERFKHVRHLPHRAVAFQLVFFSCNPDFFSSSSVHASRLRPVDWGVFGFFIALATGFAFLSSAVVPEDRSVLSFFALDSSSLKSRFFFTSPPSCSSSLPLGIGLRGGA